ncbi:hypothetical protein L596_016823 [Steinernema carpocapsae]|uniref:DDE Tnp4 domain-containing protein n=1 Tax=Steinernema carpocapsae TaxID=34508 RepID=A0A4U5NK56_STECR|nr:hypothetical protein L596_016823 [Steinernema carpocapsae]
MEDAYPDAALFRERFRLTQSQAERLLGIIGPRIRMQWKFRDDCETENLNRKSTFRAHARTRSVVERAFGVLKGRFQCLFGLRVNTPEYSAEVIKACFALHNFNIETREMDDDNEYMNGSEEDDASEAENEEIEANNEEQQFVNNFIERCNIE